jgi:hypothetical protein
VAAASIPAHALGAQTPFGPLPSSFEYDGDGLAHTNSFEEYFADLFFGFFPSSRWQVGGRFQFSRTEFGGFDDYVPPKEDLRLGVIVGPDNEAINLYSVEAFVNLLFPSSTKSVAPYVGAFAGRSGGTDIDGFWTYGPRLGVKVWPTRDWNLDFGASAAWTSGDYGDDEPAVYAWAWMTPIGGGAIREGFRGSGVTPFQDGRTSLDGRLNVQFKPNNDILFSGFVGHFFTKNLEAAAEIDLSRFDPDVGDAVTSTAVGATADYYFIPGSETKLRLYAGGNVAFFKTTDVDSYFGYGAQVGVAWPLSQNVRQFVEGRFQNFSEEAISAAWQLRTGFRQSVPMP